MKEMYAWVNWFHELSHKVADGTPEYLAERAKRVRWLKDGGDPRLLTYGDENIDPFSFIYTIAANCRSDESRTRVVQSISKLFQLKSPMPVELDDAYYFPIGPPHNALFHEKGSGNPDLLWTLFRAATKGVDSVLGEEFEEALNIGKVAIAKLTQALFLINGREFGPLDKSTKPLLSNDVPSKPDWSRYRQALQELRGAFPGCGLYEINLFAYLTGSNKLKPSGRFFQVSTDIFNDRVDHWEEFEDNSWVRAPGLAFGIPFGQDIPDSSTAYPLKAPEHGDIFLVRGSGEGKGIGVVWRNDYQQSLTEDSKVHVIWLNKSRAAFEGKAPHAHWWSRAHEIKQSFRQCKSYQPTFALLDKHWPRSGEETAVMRREDAPTSTENKKDQAKRSKLRPTTNQPVNQILYGPPGTGKTWRTVNVALQIVEGHAEDAHDQERFQALKDEGNVKVVTFHQNFAYEDFVEGIRPVLDHEQAGLRYELHRGIFQQIANAARERPNENFVLIIDEINRGNIARIFGELITLIEDSRRIGNPEETYVTLPYSNQSFGVPNNLYLIGTMNTADRSIQLLDTALRRRFEFAEMMPNPEHECMAKIEGLKCGRMLRTMNERIALLLDREHQIGHTYLLHVEDTETLANRFRKQIFPLLQEYFFDDWAKIKKVLGGSPFVVEKSAQADFLDGDQADEDRKVYSRLADKDDKWKSLASYRAIYEEKSSPTEAS